MEFAEEKKNPEASASAASSRSAKMAFTPFWASSKLPRTATTLTFDPRVVCICLACMGLTPPVG